MVVLGRYYRYCQAIVLNLIRSSTFHLLPFFISFQVLEDKIIIISEIL